MGDIATHARIQGHVRDLLHQIEPDDHYRFAELGNWLADVSQFVAPYDTSNAKLAKIWQQAEETIRDQSPGILEGLLLSNRNNMGIADAANRLLGWRQGNAVKPGALAQWMTHLAFWNGCERFRKKTPAIDPEEFEYVFQLLFTQYYPHEHLDFPPWSHGSVLGNRNPSSFAKHRCDRVPHRVNGATGTSGSEGARKVLAYLDGQIIYIAEMLTLIEIHWINLRRRSDYDQQHLRLAHILARLGRALHAIEDFFFHSNFVEIAWSKLGQPLPSNGSVSAHQLERRYQRRLRAPREYNGALSQHTSYEADFVYTGSFAGADMSHTMSDGADALAADRLLSPDWEDNILGMLITKGARKKLQDPETKRRILEKFYDSGYNAAITFADGKMMAGDWDAKSVEAFKKAWKLDQEVSTWLSRHRAGAVEALRLPYILLSPVGLFTELMVTADRDHERSEQFSRLKDQRPSRWDVEATDNRASAENIGSHSLMSKDSESKVPLRQQAINLASYVACYVARTMLERVIGATRRAEVTPPRAHSGSGAQAAFDEDIGIDWLHLLQHYLCHPDECVDDWHVAPMLADDELDAIRPLRDEPHPGNHTLRFHRADAYAQRLIDQTTTNQLKEMYDKIAVEAEQRWEQR